MRNLKLFISADGIAIVVVCADSDLLTTITDVLFHHLFCILTLIRFSYLYERLIHPPVPVASPSSAFT